MSPGRECGALTEISKSITIEVEPALGLKLGVGLIVSRIHAGR